MENLGIASVAAITVLCYLVGLVMKSTEWVDDRKIPPTMGFCGLVLGIIAYFTKMPEFKEFHIITSCAVGVVSGLAATGINQIFKQANKEE